MTRQDDLQTNSDVRRILVRHWIDLGRMSIRTANGSVYLRGVLERLHNTQTPLTAELVKNIFADIRRGQNVRRVYSDFENWIEESGGWRNIGSRSGGTREQNLHAKRGSTFIIPEGE